MKKVIIAIVMVGVLAAGHFIYREFFAHQHAYYPILSESQATELTATSSAETPSQSSQYSEWVGEWAPEKRLALRDPYYLHVELDSSGLPTYEVRFLQGYRGEHSLTLAELIETSDDSLMKFEYDVANIPKELTFEILLTYNSDTDKMEWIGTTYKNQQIIGENKVVLIRREQRDLAKDSIPYKLKRVKADMRSMATGLGSYYVVCSLYPAWVLGSHPLAFNKAPATRDMPSFRLGVKMIDQQGRARIVPFTLTTPLAYMIRYFEDPFQISPTEPQPTFVYYHDRNGWILVSPGPDGDYDINPEQDYRSVIRQPSEPLVIKAYDPTNGLVSDGDVFRVKQ